MTHQTKDGVDESSPAIDPQASHVGNDFEKLLNRDDDERSSKPSRKREHEPVVEVQRVNFTTTIKNRKIFKMHSEAVNIAILAFTILDFVMS